MADLDRMRALAERWAGWIIDDGERAELHAWVLEIADKAANDFPEAPGLSPAVGALCEAGLSIGVAADLLDEALDLDGFGNGEAEAIARAFGDPTGGRR